MWSDYEVITSIAIQHKYFYSILVIYLHTVKWLRVLLFNTNISIQYESYVYTQWSDYEYCYSTQIFLFNISHLFTHSEVITSIAIQHKYFYSILIICLHTVKWLRVLLFKTNDSIQHKIKWFQVVLCDFCNQLRAIVKEFQVLLFNPNNSIQHYSFLHTQLNSSKNCYESLIIIIIIMSCHRHRYPWPSLATSSNPSSFLVGLQGYIPYPHIAAVCIFELVVLLLPGYMWGSIGVHPLWAHPCFYSSVLYVWFVWLDSFRDGRQVAV